MRQLLGLDDVAWGGVDPGTEAGMTIWVGLCHPGPVPGSTARRALRLLAARAAATQCLSTLSSIPVAAHPLPRHARSMRERLPCVYIMASGHNGTLYVGVTSNLIGRVIQHREGTYGGFTSRYGVTRLVWLETGEDMEAAIAREKQVKRWRREWKMNLIERENPLWHDLAVGLGLAPLAAVTGGAVDPGTRPG